MSPCLFPVPRKLAVCPGLLPALRCSACGACVQWTGPGVWCQWEVTSQSWDPKGPCGDSFLPLGPPMSSPPTAAPPPPGGHSAISPGGGGGRVSRSPGRLGPLGHPAALWPRAGRLDLGFWSGHPGSLSRVPFRAAGGGTALRSPLGGSGPRFPLRIHCFILTRLVIPAQIPQDASEHTDQLHRDLGFLSGRGRALCSWCPEPCEPCWRHALLGPQEYPGAVFSSAPGRQPPGEPRLGQRQLGRLLSPSRGDRLPSIPEVPRASSWTVQHLPGAWPVQQDPGEQPRSDVSLGSPRTDPSPQHVLRPWCPWNSKKQGGVGITGSGSGAVGPLNPGPPHLCRRGPPVALVFQGAKAQWPWTVQGRAGEAELP